ncbi:MAG: NUDIX domain-containing protein [Nanoarchaeota archaeon]
MPDKKIGQTTRCTAIAYKGDKICLVETEHGLELPGGYAHWKYGSPGAVQELLHTEHGIDFRPDYVSSMIQHRTRENLPVINLTFAGLVGDCVQTEGAYWLTLNDALKQQTLNKHDKRALELHKNGTIKVPLSFIRVTEQVEQLSHVLTEPPAIRKPQKPTDFIVSGGPIRHQPRDMPAAYAFQQLNRNAGKGKLSFFGGTAEEDELPPEALKREIEEESGGKLVVQQKGLLGVRIIP